jgi:hypothetical protein
MPATVFMELIRSKITVFCNRLLVILSLFVLTTTLVQAQEASMDVPSVALDGIGFDVPVTVSGDTLGTEVYSVQGSRDAVNVEYNKRDDVWLAKGVIVDGRGTNEVVLLRSGQEVVRQSTRTIPGWLSILPPLLAIVGALVFKRVVPALFLGLWVGAVTMVSFTFKGAFIGLLNTYQVYVLESFIDADHS